MSSTISCAGWNVLPQEAYARKDNFPNNKIIKVSTLNNYLALKNTPILAEVKKTLAPSRVWLLGTHLNLLNRVSAFGQPFRRHGVSVILHRRAIKTNERESPSHISHASVL